MMTQKKIALVTGAAQGIGFACAQALLSDGLFVILADIKAAEVQSAAARLGDMADSVVCDLSKPDSIADMFRAIEAKHGPISILVNNAGIAMAGPFLDTTEESFRKVIDINVVGVFLATQHAARSMIANNIAGSIVNMSSINAVVAIPTIPAYCASKGAVMQLTKASSLALAPHGIRVNAVGPGSIDTAMMAGVNASPEAVQTAMSRTPLKRLGTPKEVGDVVAFLASDKASYVTGETIYVDGGRLGLNYTC
jgi:NAD(P)-dependent dehydrogenase (short-subunit alcohol dehydrogenase family)